MEQTDEEVAEMVARFRTPPGCNWEPLRDDIMTLLRSRREIERQKCKAAAIALMQTQH